MYWTVFKLQQVGPKRSNQKRKSLKKQIKIKFGSDRRICRWRLAHICVILFISSGHVNSTVQADGGNRWMCIRVSSETSFISKQPKLEPKLVSALSETRGLFRLFRFNIETGSFGVLKQPNAIKRQSETAANLLKYQPF